MKPNWNAEDAIAVNTDLELTEEELNKVSGGRSDGGGATVGRANFDVFTL